MTKTLKASLSVALFIVSSLSTFLLLSRCGSGDDDGGSVDYAYSYAGTFDSPDDAGANLLANTVHFTLSWDEANNEISGEYRDDHFAESVGSVSGSVSADGIRTFNVTLPSAVNGVIAFIITTDKVTGTLSDTINLSKLAAQGPGGVIVFEQAGVTITALKVTPASPQPVPEGDAGVFFSAIAKDYDYFAKNTTGQGDGTPWTHGKKYTISVGKDGKITLPTNGDPLLLTFGSNAADKYEKYDHEDYATLQVADKTQVLAQRVTSTGKVFFTHQIHGGQFWAFQEDDPGALPGKWDTLGVGFVGGAFKHKVTATTPANEAENKLGTAVEIVIGADGNVTGTFGEFKYVENETYLQQGKQGDVEFADVKYYRPDMKTFPRSILDMHFENKKWVKGSVTYSVQENNSDGSRGWQFDTTK